MLRQMRQLQQWWMRTHQEIPGGQQAWAWQRMQWCPQGRLWLASTLFPAVQSKQRQQRPRPHGHSQAMSLLRWQHQHRNQLCQQPKLRMQNRRQGQWHHRHRPPKNRWPRRQQAGPVGERRRSSHSLDSKRVKAATRCAAAGSVAKPAAAAGARVDTGGAAGAGCGAGAAGVGSGAGAAGAGSGPGGQSAVGRAAAAVGSGRANMSVPASQVGSSLPGRASPPTQSLLRASSCRLHLAGCRKGEEEINNRLRVVYHCTPSLEQGPRPPRM